jgi:hypothetical protein
MQLQHDALEQAQRRKGQSPLKRPSRRQLLLELEKVSKVMTTFDIHLTLLPGSPGLKMPPSER